MSVSPALRASPASKTALSIFSGPTTPDIQITNLGKLLEQQAALYGKREAVVCSGRARLTYQDLNDEATRVAKGLLALGVRYGDRIGILAGNCYEYVALFFATGRIGAIFVVLNTNYTAEELKNAVAQTGTNPYNHNADFDNG
jgi:long-chain acyl-CoA synthetase